MGGLLYVTSFWVRCQLLLYGGAIGRILYACGNTTATLTPLVGSVEESVSNSLVMKRISLLVVLLSALACQTAQDIVPPGAGLVGSWQYVERGYSPGAGYIIDQIPRKPVQRIDFLSDSTVRTLNITDQFFSSARTYRIDSIQRGPSRAATVSLFDAAGKLLGLQMGVGIRNDTLRLSPPCFEGCHSAFVRLRD